MKAKTFGTEAVKTSLVKHYARKSAPVSRTKAVNDLYHLYIKTNVKPELTLSNLLKVMRYIKKHNVKQSDYKKVIAKVATTTPVLSKTDFGKLYDQVVKSIKPQGIKKATVLDIYNDIFTGIKKVIDTGNNVRLNKFGIFKGVHVPKKTYRIPNPKGTSTTTTVNAHIRPKFYASNTWKNALRK